EHMCTCFIQSPSQAMRLLWLSSRCGQMPHVGADRRTPASKEVRQGRTKVPAPTPFDHVVLPREPAAAGRFVPLLGVKNDIGLLEQGHQHPEYYLGPFPLFFADRFRQA